MLKETGAQGACLEKIFSPSPLADTFPVSGIRFDAVKHIDR